MEEGSENHHVYYLQQLCRLCKNKIVEKGGYVNRKNVEEYSDVIYTVYDIDVEYEDFHVYPKCLCSSCVRTLNREKKKQEQGKVTRHLDAPNFGAHKQDCEFCKVNTLFSGLHIKNLDTSMLKSGFNKLVENTNSFKRI